MRPPCDNSLVVALKKEILTSHEEKLGFFYVFN